MINVSVVLVGQFQFHFNSPSESLDHTTTVLLLVLLSWEERKPNLGYLTAQS